jgi:hypothetical protein
VAPETSFAGRGSRRTLTSDAVPGMAPEATPEVTPRVAAAIAESRERAARSAARLRPALWIMLVITLASALHGQPRPGLTGMRERLAQVGGSAQAGPTEGADGWTVRMEVPA